VAVRFEGVSFKHSGRAVIRNFTLEVSLKKQIAIIGEIGSGKTTFLKLLCGELPPSGGRILVRFDDGSVRDLWTRPVYESLRNQLGYVPQEAFVSSDLFHANISLSAAGADRREEDISAAAYWAELEADLSAFPDGLSQQIGESGVNLSGGQRQRLNLA